jgi:lipid-binding SYLF domain-containing protein
VKYKKKVLLAVVGMLSITTLSFGKSADKVKDEQDRLHNAANVMQEIMNVPDNIPQNLLDKARCVIVMPSVVKGAFIVGASYGRGAMVCRTGKNYSGSWSAPAMYALEGGSIGLQIGGQATDYVLLVMNDHGANSLLHSKVKLGADISAAAGPVGRSASADTDAYLRSEILSYSRSRGAFVGISLEGSTLRPDDGADRDLYGRDVTASQIISGEVRTPDGGHELVAMLDRVSPKLKS